MENYEALGTIGEGTYGVVLKARHKETGRVVAIKKFKESEEDEQVRKTALREVRILKQLKHENIVNLLEVFRRPRDKKLFLVFEFVEKTILEELENHPYGLEELEVKKYTFQLLRAVEYCHANNIVHRDVKPENILVSRNGVLKLCDFGFARTMGGPGTKYTDYVATRWYRSPELLVGDTEYGKAVDVWAIGCMVAEIATGIPLFPGESDIDQLFHIIRCFGRLTTRQIQIFRRNPLYTGIELPEPKEPETLDKRLAGSITNKHLLVMLKGCLLPEPEHRDQCTGLLGHAYFLHNGFFGWFEGEFVCMKDRDDAYLRMQARNHKRPRSRERRRSNSGSGPPGLVAQPNPPTHPASQVHVPQQQEPAPAPVPFTTAPPLMGDSMFAQPPRGGMQGQPPPPAPPQGRPPAGPAATPALQQGGSRGSTPQQTLHHKEPLSGAEQGLGIGMMDSRGGPVGMGAGGTGPFGVSSWPSQGNYAAPKPTEPLKKKWASREPEPQQPEQRVGVGIQEGTWGDLFLQQHQQRAGGGVPPDGRPMTREAPHDVPSELLPPEPPAQAFSKPSTHHGHRHKAGGVQAGLTGSMGPIGESSRSAAVGPAGGPHGVAPGGVALPQQIANLPDLGGGQSRQGDSPRHGATPRLPVPLVAFPGGGGGVGGGGSVHHHHTHHHHHHPHHSYVAQGGRRDSDPSRSDRHGDRHSDRHGSDRHGGDRHGGDRHGGDRHGGDRHGDRHGGHGGDTQPSTGVLAHAMGQHQHQGGFGLVHGNNHRSSGSTVLPNLGGSDRLGTGFDTPTIVLRSKKKAKGKEKDKGSGGRMTMQLNTPGQGGGRTGGSNPTPTYHALGYTTPLGSTGFAYISRTSGAGGGIAGMGTLHGPGMHGGPGGGPNTNT
eukprot:Hpha_TRINITY_DN15720_c0_g7::TRINITY_DN15720_c0_g7_i1::g.39758::m.39758/K08824/CDKL; cyclin-dependent kinase-like